ncbi:hypothetical protein [Mesorhizobium sp.]|uniref:hypothetical protein n=1 Tax=Mesorhizobium sp. TaxID=1871066 RepID=UPI00121AEB81|nr:hypothetical protein [Mesorhizobium sp.]TIO08673.1 MAG: hypothetical protein E5X88_11650 [Mesorhizobium sp.]TIO36192.1 MAG: hypothetical protein E5X89_05275 [Mesorhizobium sp.]TIP11191.1 MAG: hypothetical protein E5X73_18645 [Mesorhizobium sp.]
MIAITFLLELLYTEGENQAWPPHDTEAAGAGRADDFACASLCLPPSLVPASKETVETPVERNVIVTNEC